MPTQIESQLYLSVSEVAERLSKNPETVRKWIREKKLPARKLGLQYFVHNQDLEVFRKARG